MMQPHTALDDLTPEERSELERHLVAFDLRWQPGGLRGAVAGLPGPARWRWAGAVELVRVDLEKRWQRGERPTLEEYLAAVPELGGPDGLPADLIHLEYRLRDRHGTRVDLDEYARRYPRQADELRELALRPSASTPGLSVESRPDSAESAISWAPDERPAADAPLPTDSGPTPPFGRYRVVRLLGRGGMGAVYLAHDPRLERDVALKIPAEGLRADPRAVEQMLREARAAARLHHPNICPVYDVGVVDGVPFITSHYINGEPLSAVARRTPPVPGSEAARIVASVARALDHAHRQGVIHRDLKPSNIMLDRGGNPVVMDFGLARRLPPDGSNATMTGLVGSPAYMAPEQVAHTRAGPASDIFSLGVVLYELLAGRVPFQGSVPDVLERVVSDEPPPPSRVRPGIDPALEAVCLKAMAKRPEDRFRSMAELAAALDVLGGRRRVPAVLAAASAVLLVCGGVWWMNRPGPPAEPHVVPHNPVADTGPTEAPHIPGTGTRPDVVPHGAPPGTWPARANPKPDTRPDAKPDTQPDPRPETRPDLRPHEDLLPDDPKPGSDGS
jgi:serine/threonine-protein kinase